MGFIVTPNRTEELDAPKWLLREVSEPLSAARPFDAVIARGIEFRKSRDKDEIGFGHGIVAYCGEAKGHDATHVPRRTRDEKEQAERVTFIPEEGIMRTTPFKKPVSTCRRARFQQNGLTYVLLY